MKALLTARELAALALPGIPGTVSGVIRLATRESWSCQSPAGRGGGKEYPLHALPPAAQVAAIRALWDDEGLPPEVVARQHHGISKAMARRAVAALVEVLREEVTANGEARLAGLGTFRVVERPARTGRNPRTGVEIRIPAKRVIQFRPAKVLEEVTGKCG